MGVCVSGPSPAETRALENRKKEITRFEESFAEKFSDLELDFGTICHVFLVGLGGTMGPGNGLTGQPELISGAFSIRDHATIIQAAERAHQIAQSRKNGKVDTYHTLTGAFLIAGKTIPRPYNEQLPDPNQDNPNLLVEKSKLREDYDLLERFGEQIVKGELISGTGRNRRGIETLKKTFEPWASSISEPVKTGGPRGKIVGVPTTGLIPQAKKCLEQIESLKNDIEVVQAVLSPLIIQWLKEWLANPHLYQHRQKFEGGAYSCFKGPHFETSDLRTWKSQAEDLKRNGAKQRDEIYQREFDAFVAARSKYVQDLFTRMKENVEAMMPEYEAWKLSISQEEESGGVIELTPQSVSDATPGKYVSLTAPVKMHFSSLPGHWERCDGLDSFKVDLSGEMGAQQPMAFVKYRDAVKEDLIKINAVFAKAVQKAKEEELKTPGNGFVIRSQISMLTPFDVVGEVEEEQTKVYATTFRAFTSEEERIKRGDFRNDHERLENMRSYGTGPSVCYNGTNYHESSHQVPATTISMKALHRKPTTTEDAYPSYLRFGDKSCLDGLEDLLTC